MSFSDMTNCEYLPLTKVLSFIVDNRGKTVPTVEEGIPLIATNCIKNNELYPVFEKVRYLSQDTYDNWFRAHPIPGDIIFVNKGTPGRVCLVPNPVGFCIAQDMMAFRVDYKIISNKYLFAVLRSQQFQMQIEQFHVGTLIPHFKKGDLDKLLIPIPSRTVQNYIGETYYALCNKIELNNRINKTLEEMAQAIFKSWFVDFEPFQDGEFEDSELGKIPKGWKVGRADEFFDIAIGKTPPRKEPQWFSTNEDDVKWISISDMGNCGLYIFNTSEYLTKDGIEKYNVKIVPANTVLLSFKLTVGRVAITSQEMTTNEAIAHFKSTRNNINEFLYFYLKNFNYDSLGNTSSIASAVNSKVIKSMTMLMPDDNALSSYSHIVNPLIAKIRQNQEEINTLTSIRDALLPKLMSGEIRVPIEEVQ